MAASSADAALASAAFVPGRSADPKAWFAVSRVLPYSVDTSREVAGESTAEQQIRLSLTTFSMDAAPDRQLTGKAKTWHSSSATVASLR